MSCRPRFKSPEHSNTRTVPTMIGALVDVSGSMKRNVVDRGEEEGGSWARSIFKVVDELIKHDVSISNQIFALAFGSRCEADVFDLLSTVGEAGKVNEDQSAIEDLRSRRSKGAMIEDALTILESNGAPRVRYWGKMDVLLKVIDDTTAAAILHYLRKSADFTKRFVDDCLPRECREVVSDGIRGIAKEGVYLLAHLGSKMGSRTCSEVQSWGSEDSVREAIEKGKQLVAAQHQHVQVKLVDVRKAAIMSVQNASKILHTSVGDQEVTNERVDELVKAVEPYIYGSTPLMEAMNHSVKLFSYREFENHQKLLFIVSDGEPNNRNNLPLELLSNLGVTIVSCFITDQKLSHPRRLYSIQDESWEEPAKFMFSMSSTITTQEIPRTLFVKNGWQIDIDNNETRLFFQVNHPAFIQDVCHIAKKAVLSQYALSDALSSVDLDLYINEANKWFDPKKQDEATCYAIASATVLHLAMKRIIGRDGGYPDFFELRKELIAKYGEHGASTKKVLAEICPKYRLQCQPVDAIGAMEAISAKRPVVARFHLTGAQSPFQNESSFETILLEMSLTGWLTNM